jgi:tetratricopeptide (TPR) repeat protein
MGGQGSEPMVFLFESRGLGGFHGFLSSMARFTNLESPRQVMGKALTQPEKSFSVLARSYLIATIFTLISALGISAEAQWTKSPVDLPAEQVLEFANYLFSQQEYVRAIGEYERFLFLYPDNFQAPNAALRIVQCYFRGKRWQQAVEAADSFLSRYPKSSLEWEARFLKARSFGEMGRGDEARDEYLAIIADRPGKPLEAEAWYLIGLSYAKEGRWLEADEALRQVGSNDSQYGAAKEVQQIVAEESQAKGKDPALAGFLAAILPGAGHFYCERPRDGTLALVFTGAFAFATYEAFNQGHEGVGIGLAVVTAAFYGGNIYSAVNVAHKYNDREERRQQQRLAPYEQESFNQPRVPALSLSLRFSF